MTQARRLPRLRTHPTRHADHTDRPPPFPEKSKPSQNLLGADDDVRAVMMWLKAKGNRSSHTFSAYFKEVKRFLTWLSVEGLSLSSLNVHDVHRYLTLLTCPPKEWLRPRKPCRHEILKPTQLLTHGLSQRSLQQARTILGQLFSYLQNARYVRGNPFKLSMNFSVQDEHVMERTLDTRTWRYLWQWLERRCTQFPKRTAMMRDRWLMALLYHTGLRREEVARARMRDCHFNDHGWTLKVEGKGGKIRRITLNHRVMEQLSLYRQCMGYTPLPDGQEDDAPLILSLHPKRHHISMTPRRIGMMVHTIAQQASQTCQDVHIRNMLEAISTHWMRHTHATHRLAAGASLESTQDEMGHTDPKTTRIYAKVLDQQRQQDAEKLANWDQKQQSS